MFLPDDGNLCDTIVSENTDLRINNIPESIDSVIYSLNIGGTKYWIYSQKIETDTHITIHKMTERLDSNRFLKVLMMKEKFNYF